MQRGDQRRAVGRVLVVPRLHVDRGALRQLHGARRMEVRGHEAQPAAEPVLRAVPQLRAALRHGRAAPRPVTALCTY